MPAGLGASSARAESLYGFGAVQKAFSSHGLRLYDTGYDQPNTVKILATVKPPKGWTLGVYVYLKEKDAKAAFDKSIKAWLTSGMAAARAKNVVVAVVPNGRTLGRPAKRYPLPQPVVGAMATLTKR